MLGFEPSLDWLSQNVPLWAALLAAFTAPYRWAGYAKAATGKIVEQHFGVDTNAEETEG